MNDLPCLPARVGQRQGGKHLPTAHGRDEGWKSTVELSDRILQGTSATRELERWCRERSIGVGLITAAWSTAEAAPILDDDSLEALNCPTAIRTARFRRVQLMSGGTAVALALNWYFPKNLSPAMQYQLRTTNTPFGKVVASLHPWRRTFFIERYMPAGFADVNDVAFEHRAVVRAGGGAPLAVVHERFLNSLVQR